MAIKKTKKRNLNIPIDEKTAVELEAHVDRVRKTNDPFITISDIVRGFIREGLKSATIAS